MKTVIFLTVLDFLGPPACGRRYVSQLAVRSALRQQAGSVWPAATAAHR